MSKINFDFRDWYNHWVIRNDQQNRQVTVFDGMLEAFIKGREIGRSEGESNVTISCNGEFHAILFKNGFNKCGVCNSVFIENK